MTRRCFCIQYDPAMPEVKLKPTWIFFADYSSNSGSRYQYSSIGILLASKVAKRITETEFHKFIEKSVFQPLGMQHFAWGLGRFKLEETVRCQVVQKVPESGSGDPAAKKWDWNLHYWRSLGAPWRGVHASATDVARFLTEFLHPQGKVVRPETARLILHNHNRKGLTPRGLGLAIGTEAGSPGCSEQTFQHTGTTGTLAWAGPETDTICVVLTTLPGHAVNPHSRRLAADLVATAVG